MKNEKESNIQSHFDNENKTSDYFNKFKLAWSL